MTDTYQIIINIDGNDNASQKLKGVNDELTDMKQTGDNASDGVKGLNNAITQAGIIAAAWKIKDKVNELADLGREVQVADRVFTSLAGGTDQAAQALERMRAATNGSVDNLTLMSGANQLLLTNLATSTDQAAELTQVAVQLGKAMGQDAASAIDNFNSALLNNSYVRLDTLGISAQRVRERVEELKEAGMDMSQAFAQATLEQGRAAIERLGSAADVSNTAFNRLSIGIENQRQRLGEWLANAAETAAQMGIILDILLGGDGFGTIDRENSVYAQALDIQERAGGKGNVGGNIPLEDVIAFAEQNPDLFGEIVNKDAFNNRTSAFNGSTFTGAPIDQGVLNDVAGQFGFNINALTPQGQNLAFSQLAGAFDVVAEAQQRVNPIFTETTNAINTQTDAMDSHAGATAKSAEAIEDSAETQAQALRDATLAQEEFLTSLQSDQLDFVGQLFGEGVSSRGDNLFFDPEQVAEIVSQADQLEQRADEIARLAEETDFEIITPEEVDTARDMADQARDIADSAIEAADALERASLSDIFGQTDGGRLGEITDAIANNIQDEDARAAFLDQANLATGRDTLSSQAFEDEFAPTLARIAEEFGTDAAIAAATRLNESLTESAASGLSQEQTVANAQQALGFRVTGDGQPQTSTTVQAGEGRISVANRLGITREELDSVIGEGTVLQPGQVITLGEGTQLVAINDSAIAQSNFAQTIGQGGFDTSIYNGFDPSSLSGFGGLGIDGALGDQGTPGADTTSARGNTNSRFTEDDVVNAQAIEQSMSDMTSHDLSLVIDPIITDISEANTQADLLETSLTNFSNTQFKATIPLQIIMDDQSGLNLAENPSFQAAIAVVFANQGISLEALREVSG